jgi:hypothetical protein
MKDTFSTAAVKVTKAIRFYTAPSSQKAICEKELAADGLSVMLWAEGETEQDALEMAMRQVALRQLEQRAK